MKLVHPEWLIEGIVAAIQAGESVRGNTSPNPPVGCLLIDASGNAISSGATQPAGGAHAEAVALREAGERARGATAIVTLEPCNHTGRTGPCAQALVDAGVAEVVYLVADPNPVAAGGAQYLREHGVKVTHMPNPVGALEPWLTATRLGRPAVTWKYAATADGFTAAADGTSQWITGDEAREFAHEDRATRDAIIVGSGTALADQPKLTARKPDGTLYEHQPRRVVIGSRAAAGEIPGDYECYATPQEALQALWDTGARDVLLEGGAGLAHSFLAADSVDMVQAYIAPMFLGTGRGVLAGPVAETLADARRFAPVRTMLLGKDVIFEMKRQA